MGIVIRTVVNAFALWVLTLIPILNLTVTPFEPSGDLQYVLTLLIVALIFGVVNAVLGTIIKIVAFPLFILTLGLISLLLNGVLLLATAWITGFFGWGLSIEGFWPAVLAGILLAVINAVFGVILRPQRARRVAD